MTTTINMRKNCASDPSCSLSDNAGAAVFTDFPKSLILDTSPGDGGGLDSLSFAVDCFLATRQPQLILAHVSFSPLVTTNVTLTKSH